MMAEQGQSFQQDTKTMEKRYQGCWNTNMMANYCWCWEKEVDGSSYSNPEKHRKGNFKISNHALFSLMKKVYAIMFGLFLAF